MEGGSGDWAVDQIDRTTYGNLVCSIFQCISEQYTNIHAKKTESGGVTTWGNKTKAERDAMFLRADLGVKIQLYYIWKEKMCGRGRGLVASMVHRWKSNGDQILGRSTS